MVFTDFKLVVFTDFDRCKLSYQPYRFAKCIDLRCEEVLYLSELIKCLQCSRSVVSVSDDMVVMLQFCQQWQFSKYIPIGFNHTEHKCDLVFISNL